KRPLERRPETSSAGAQRRPVASSGASLPSPCGGCTGVLSFTMRSMQRGSPLSTPPANEQRRCAEKTSRIFRRKSAFTMRRLHRGSLVHHAEDAKGFSPLNPARKRAAEVRRADQSHLQAEACLHHAEAAQGFSRSACC